MAVTITTADVLLIIDVDNDVAIETWDALVNTAKILIDKLPQIEDECGIECADEVAKYLAAHLITLRDPRQVRQTTLDATDVFESKVGLGLDGSSYGQMAKVLDCTGSLSKIDTDESDGARPNHIFLVDGR